MEKSVKDSTHYLIKGYPGLEHTAEYIKPLIPPSDTYIEVFAGMGRTVEIEKHNTVVLNDMSDFAVKTLKEKFPTAIVTQLDYSEVIKNSYKDPDTFLFIDPPWRKNIYKNNAKPVFTHDSPIKYYDKILFYLSDAKCKWILCVDKDEHEIGSRVSRSGWVNKVYEHPTKKLYGRPIGVRLASNMWSKND
jgi:hypothetical protein|tara:strand:+ start:2981 stop:3550 length:570 start_codon:yes stop_codon:yes gene_type:complete